MEEKEDELSIKFIQKVEISSADKKIGNDLFDFSIQWLPSNEDILVSGNTSLGIVSRDGDGQWSLTLEDAVHHEHPISTLVAISEEILVTYSMEDKAVKVWRFGDDGCKSIWDFKHSLEISSIIYSEKLSSLALLDIKGAVCFLQGDFSKTQEEAEQAEKQRITDE